MLSACESSETATTPESSDCSREPSTVKGVLWVHPKESFTAFAESGALTLGRGPDCEVVLEGAQVSRRHAVLRRLGPIDVVSDANSRNGTLLNGHAIREAPIALGDVLRVGDWVGVALELEQEIAEAGPYFATPTEGLLVGPRSRQAWSRAARAATGGTPILIEGPTGTGKEVFARAIHQLSQRAGEFVAVNCAALPEALVEANLFGHSKGAFTGAAQASEGLIAAAHRGTLLFDEIVDLPAPQQAKLLRVLEESAVLRVGETTPRPVDVRFLAACQEPLGRLVEQGRFRADLLGRLAGFTVRLLPLQKRREDIPRLFARAFEAAGREPALLKPSAIEALCLAPWPLNVRELVHAARFAASSVPHGEAITRATLNAIGSELERAPGARGLAQQAPPTDTHARDALEEARLGRRRMLWLRRHEHRLAELLDALRAAQGNVSLAARSVGLSRSAAARLLEANAQRQGPLRDRA